MFEKGSKEQLRSNSDGMLSVRNEAVYPMPPLL